MITAQVPGPASRIQCWTSNDILCAPDASAFSSPYSVTDCAISISRVPQVPRVPRCLGASRAAVGEVRKCAHPQSASEAL